MNHQLLAGKVAVITGSGQGIGRGIAKYFSQCGAKVVTNNRHPYQDKSTTTTTVEKAQQPDDQKRSDAAQTAKEINDAGGTAFPCFADVSDPAGAKHLIETAIEKFGRVDILINNAAALGEGTVTKTDEGLWNKLVASKMTGAFNTMHYALPFMIKQGSGTILNSASNAWVGIANLAAYSAANAGLVGLTKASAKELLDSGITVNAYCPQAMSPGHLREFNKTINALKKQFGPAAQPSPAKLKAINREHGNPEKIGPFLAYLCTADGHQYSGDVFGVTANNEISYYNEPQVISQIKSNSEWSLSELKKIVPEELLKDYQPLSQRDNWNNQAADPLSKGKIFKRGKELAGFAGNGPDYVNLFIGPNDPSKCSVGNVTMAPGTHSNWHQHGGKQLLLVTGGHGLYQEWGQAVQKVKAGDVIEVPRGTKHWHGADHQHWFTCIGMILNADYTTKDCGPVTNYDQLD